MKSLSESKEAIPQKKLLEVKLHFPTPFLHHLTMAHVALPVNYYCSSQWYNWTSTITANFAGSTRESSSLWLTVSHLVPIPSAILPKVLMKTSATALIHPLLLSCEKRDDLSISKSLSLKETKANSNCLK